MTKPEVRIGDSIPTVAIPKKRAPVYIFAAALAALAILLFVSLESARMARTTTASDLSSANEEHAPVSEPATELYIPPAPTSVVQFPLVGASGQLAPVYPPAQFRPVPVISPVIPRPALPAATYTPPPAAVPPPFSASMPAMPGSVRTETDVRSVMGSPERILAGRIRNLSSTVVQGTLIRAVLETPVDSTRPGQARALVTRDVKGFDGTQVLIPRGSRLFGEYGSEATGGQNRLMIRWSRLILPGGMSVALDSPVADSLGRAGIRAHVDSHLLTRIGNALIEGSGSVVGGLVGRKLGGGNQVIVALPGAVQAGAAAAVPAQITPTLKVRQGERISVFVAHDLDFAESAS